MNNESFAPAWVFYVGIVIALAGTYADYWKSMRQMAYGKYEATKWNRNKYRYLDPVKFWLWKALLIIPFLAIYFLTGEGAFGFGLWMIGFLGFFITIKDLPEAAANRREQIEDLRALSKIKIYNYMEALAVLNSRDQGDKKEEPIFIAGGRGRIADFGWFYVDGLRDDDPGDMVTVAEKCVPAIWNLAQLPENQWFANTKERRVN